MKASDHPSRYDVVGRPGERVGKGRSRAEAASPGPHPLEPTLATELRIIADLFEADPKALDDLLSSNLTDLLTGQLDAERSIELLDAMNRGRDSLALVQQAVLRVRRLIDTALTRLSAPGEGSQNPALLALERQYSAKRARPVGVAKKAGEFQLPGGDTRR